MKTAENYDRLLTLSETSRILHVCPNTLRNWDKNGTLKAVRFGVKRIRRFRKSDVDRLILDAMK